MIEQLPIIPILIFSVIVHEVAHGYMALRLGDPTARERGRLTLNPIPHIDLIGSVLVPVMSIAAAGHVFIAWAKPVPVNPMNFRRPLRDSVLVSAVGPLANFALALVCACVVIATGFARSAVSDPDAGLPGQVIHFILTMFYGGMYINVVLGVFNLIPLPPLDGSHMFAALLPPRAAMAYMRIGFIGVLVVLFAMRVRFVSDAFSAVIGGAFSPYRALVELFIN
ncbi:MAG TPA: site-2 protease family protein [Bacteroidota bacterium]|nr:site-2 protease family protein [Bacteroidota bacterium]